MQVSNKQGIVELVRIGVDCNLIKVCRVAFCILISWHVEKEKVSHEHRCKEDAGQETVLEFTLSCDFGLPEFVTYAYQSFLITSRLGLFTIGQCGLS